MRLLLRKYTSLFYLYEKKRAMEQPVQSPFHHFLWASFSAEDGMLIRYSLGNVGMAGRWSRSNGWYFHFGDCHSGTFTPGNDRQTSRTEYIFYAVKCIPPGVSRFRPPDLRNTRMASTE
eukprot:gene18953-902_t